jgi:hypothetical protein
MAEQNNVVQELENLKAMMQALKAEKDQLQAQLKAQKEPAQERGAVSLIRYQNQKGQESPKVVISKASWGPGFPVDVMLDLATARTLQASIAKVTIPDTNDAAAWAKTPLKIARPKKV